jgi:hypothetical protein
VLDVAIASAVDELEWTVGGFALAASYDEATGDFSGLVLPGPDASFGPITDTTLLVAPHLAAAQLDRARDTSKSVAESPQGSKDEGAAGAEAATPPTEPPEQPATIPNTIYRSHLSIDASGDIATQLSGAAESLLKHLQSAGPDALDITLTVDAERMDGFDDRTVRIVSENGTTLGFVDNRFRDS